MEKISEIAIIAGKKIEKIPIIITSDVIHRFTTVIMSALSEKKNFPQLKQLCRENGLYGGKFTEKSLQKTHMKYLQKHIDGLDIVADPDNNNASETSTSDSSNPSDIPDTGSSRVETLFRRIEQMLYNEGIVGEKARNIILKFFIWRMIQPLIDSDKLNIMNVDEYELLNPDDVKYVKFSELTQVHYVSIKGIIEEIWNEVLAKNPFTKSIFRFREMPVIQSDMTYYTIVKDLTQFDFESLSSDILSEVYQHFIHKQFKGEKSNKLGQHFTPKTIIDLIRGIAGKYITPDSHVCDPFMGTGGFLLTAYKLLRELSPERDIIDQIHGIEIDPDVANYANANLLISSGNICANLFTDNTLTHNFADKKYDLILSNPPFALKLNSYDKNKLFSSPVKTNNGNLICLLLLCSLLNKNGTCVTVWPCGNEMNNKRRGEYETRKYICDNFHLEKIIYLPAGIFEYTNIKTVILVISAKTPDESTEIAFCEYSEGNTVEKIRKNIGQIREKNYSWVISDYVDIVREIGDNDSFELKKLGEICEFMPKSKRSASFGESAGEFPFFTSSQKLSKYCNIADYDGEYIIIGCGGVANIHYIDGKFSASMHCFVMKTVKSVSNKYVYYYLLYNINILAELFTGVALKFISKSSLVDIQIPICSEGLQTQIIKSAELRRSNIQLYNNVFSATQKIIDDITVKGFCFTGKTEFKKLGELCETFPTSKRTTSEGNKEGKYRFYNSSDSIKLYLDVYEIEEECIIIGNGGSVNIHIDSKFTPSKHVTVLKLKNEIDKIISLKYLYYYISHNRKYIDENMTGIAIKWISREKILNMDIPVLSEEKQKEFIDWYENKLSEIQSLTSDQNYCMEKIKSLTEQIKRLWD